MLVAGAGVKGGQVFGQTDLDQLDEHGQFKLVSKAHLQMDSQCMKRMGKPFDFDKMVPVDAMPEIYNGDHYLTIGSVINSIYENFGVDRSKYWTNNRNGAPARTIKGLFG